MSDYQTVEDDSPDRCQAVTKRLGGGQCFYKKIEGLDYCRIHQGPGLRDLQSKKMRNYRLGKFQQRMEEFADNDQIKSLREEVGISRILLEEILNKCNGENDLILYSSKISDLVGKIEKLVVSCHKLEQATGMLLDKTRITHLADVIVRIIGEHVTDPDVLTKISHEILGEIVSLQGVQQDVNRG